MIAKYTKIIQKQSYPVRFLVASVLMYSGLSKYMKIRRNGYVLRFGKSAIARLMWIDKNALRKDENFYQDYLRKGDIYIDIGANVGHLACCAANLIGKDSSALCVEANSKTFQTLKENLSLNKLNHVKAVCCAIGEHNGVLYFDETGSDDIHHVDTKSKSTNSIACLNMDALISAIPMKSKNSQTLLKIDIEGFELFAFKGGQQLLKSVDTIYFECNEMFCRRYNHTQQDVFKVIKDFGFDIYEIKQNKLHTLDTKTPPQKANLVATMDIQAFLERAGYKMEYR